MPDNKKKLLGLNTVKPQNASKVTDNKEALGSGRNMPTNSTNNNMGSGKPKNKNFNGKPFNKKPHRQFNRKESGNQYQGNDIQWYMRDPILLDTAKQITFNIPFGRKLKSLNTSVPGIIQVKYAPTIGFGNTNHTDVLYRDEDDFYDTWTLNPFNQSVIYGFEKVRSSKQGSRPYDSADYGQMLLSAMSIYAYIIHLQRLLSCFNYFNFNNTYLGTGLIRALGGRWADISEHYMEYATRLNLLISRSKMLVIPKGIAAFDEWAWRNSTIFKDTATENIKQQYIVNVPVGYYKYNEFQGKAEFVAVDAQADWDSQSFGDKLSLMEEALAALWNSETFAILMGDIASVFQQETLRLEPYDINSIPKIEYNLEFAIGFQNMTTVSKTFKKGNGTSDVHHVHFSDEALVLGLTVQQDLRQSIKNNGTLYCGPTYNREDISTHLTGIHLVSTLDWNVVKDVCGKINDAAGGINMFDYQFINTYVDQPTGDMILYATRMTAAMELCNKYGRADDSDNDKLHVRIWSSTPCLFLYVSVITRAGESFGIAEVSELYLDMSVDQQNYVPPYYLYLANFALAPKCCVYYITQSISSSFAYPIGDIDVPTEVSLRALANLQYICLYSQWLLPEAVSRTGFTPRRLH